MIKVIRNKKSGFQKGHPVYPGVEKGWFKKGHTPWNKGMKGYKGGFVKGHKGYKGMLGKRHSIKSRLKMSATRKRLLKEGKVIIPTKRQDVRKKLSTFHKGKKHTNKTKLKLSKIRKKLWQNKEYREKVIKAQLKGLFKRPTSLEKEFIKIFKKYNLPFTYCGNGSLLIGWKNPDFYENNGKKICIEVAYDYFKKRDFGSRKNYEKKRIEHFAKHGWKCLVFWGTKGGKTCTPELSEQEIVNKILEW